MTEFDVVLEHAYKTFPRGVRAVIDFNAELRAKSRTWPTASKASTSPASFSARWRPMCSRVAPGQYVHVEQHRHAQDHIYKMGDRETLCWNAEAAVLLEDSRRPESLDAA